MNWISIDFDFFYPSCNLGPEDDEACASAWRESRARPRLSDFSPERFVQALRPILRQMDRIIVAVGHEQAYTVLLPLVSAKDRVYNFDAHNDFYNCSSLPNLSCGNWAELLQKKTKVAYTWVFPNWKHKKTDVNGVMRSVNCRGMDEREVSSAISEILPGSTGPVLFVCESPGWVHPRLHGAFLKFVSRLRRISTGAKVEILPQVCFGVFRSPLAPRPQEPLKKEPRRYDDYIWPLGVA
jgi:hypothetical protein